MNFSDSNERFARPPTNLIADGGDVSMLCLPINYKTTFFKG